MTLSDGHGGVQVGCGVEGRGGEEREQHVQLPVRGAGREQLSRQRGAVGEPQGDEGRLGGQQDPAVGGRIGEGSGVDEQCQLWQQYADAEIGKVEQFDGSRLYGAGPGGRPGDRHVTAVPLLARDHGVRKRLQRGGRRVGQREGSRQQPDPIHRDRLGHSTRRRHGLGGQLPCPQGGDGGGQPDEQPAPSGTCGWFAQHSPLTGSRTITPAASRTSASASRASYGRITFAASSARAGCPATVMLRTLAAALPSALSNQ